MAGYVLHLMAMYAINPFVPRDAPALYVICSLIVFCGHVGVCASFRKEKHLSASVIRRWESVTRLIQFRFNFDGSSEEPQGMG
jgi:hypothetical protein